MRNSSEIEDLIYTETENRLKEMQDPAYQYPKRIGKGDKAGIVSAVVISLILIILCMLGVIR